MKHEGKLAWRKDPRVRALLVVLTVLATVLLGSQLLAYARPAAQRAWQSALRPVARFGYDTGIYLLGNCGPWVDGALLRRLGYDSGD